MTLRPQLVPEKAPQATLRPSFRAEAVQCRLEPEGAVRTITPTTQAQKVHFGLLWRLLDKEYPRQGLVSRGSRKKLQGHNYNAQNMEIEEKA